jgi:hypothetical protein
MKILFKTKKVSSDNIGHRIECTKNTKDQFEAFSQYITK